MRLESALISILVEPYVSIRAFARADAKPEERYACSLGPGLATGQRRTSSWMPPYTIICNSIALSTTVNSCLFF